MTTQVECSDNLFVSSGYYNNTKENSPVWRSKETLLRYNSREIITFTVLAYTVQWSVAQEDSWSSKKNRFIHLLSTLFIYCKQDGRGDVEYSCLANNVSELTEASSKKFEEIARFRTSLVLFRYCRKLRVLIFCMFPVKLLILITNLNLKNMSKCSWWVWGRVYLQSLVS